MSSATHWQPHFPSPPSESPAALWRAGPASCVEVQVWGERGGCWPHARPDASPASRFPNGCNSTQSSSHCHCERPQSEGGGSGGQLEAWRRASLTPPVGVFGIHGDPFVPRAQGPPTHCRGRRRGSVQGHGPCGFCLDKPLPVAEELSLHSRAEGQVHRARLQPAFRLPGH